MRTSENAYLLRSVPTLMNGRGLPSKAHCFAESLPRDPLEAYLLEAIFQDGAEGELMRLCVSGVARW